MKQSPAITSVMTNASFFASDLQKRIYVRLKRSGIYRKKTVIERSAGNGMEEMNTCTVDTPVNGVVQISYVDFGYREARRMHLPVTTQFMVTCIEGRAGVYHAAIVSSLS